MSSGRVRDWAALAVFAAALAAYVCVHRGFLASAAGLF